MTIDTTAAATTPSTGPRVLITGATGFLGAALVAVCVEAGLAVQTTGRNTVPGRALPGYRPADLCDAAQVAPLMTGIDCVVHAAGLAHQFKASQRDQDAFRAANVDATENVVRAAAEARVAHVVLVSSVAVYGGSAAHEDVPCQPRGPYAESKYLAEQRAIELATARGLRLTIVRPATIYGEGDPGNVARLMRTIDRGRFVWVGAGRNRKSLIYREDAARACLAVIRSSDSGVQTYNLSAPPEPMRAVVEGLATALGRRVPGWHIPARLVLTIARAAARASGGRGRLGSVPQTAQKWLADDVYPAQRFEQRFGFTSYVALGEGLRREVAWYRRQAS